jgi:oxaloacetate decarboxylase gamma subunit
MTIAEMFGQSGILAILGMAVVFSFLVILIIAMNLVARLVRAAGWDGDILPSAAPAGSAAAADPAVAAAITAAVAEHRKTNA